MHGDVFNFNKKLLLDTRSASLAWRWSTAKIQPVRPGLYRSDLDGIVSIERQSTSLNLLLDSYCEVHQSIGWIDDHLRCPKLNCAAANGGGSVTTPLIYLDTSCIGTLGWQPKQSLRRRGCSRNAPQHEPAQHS
jgi:hypothetical protein